MMMLGWIFFLIWGSKAYITQNLKQRKIPEIIIYIVFECLLYSVNPHKEDRFILKIVPFFLILIGLGVREFHYSGLTKKTKRIILRMLIFLNLFFFAYSGLIDKRGAIDVMDYIRKHSNEVEGLVLFTECHRTPYYSHIHRLISKLILS